MIWTLTIECIGGRFWEEECIRKVELESNTSLYDLHLFIQQMMDFDNDHLFEFFVGRNARNRQYLFVEDYYPEILETAFSEISLEQVYPLPAGMKLHYLFDFGDSWYFEIKKSRKKPREPEKGVKYPRIIEAVGPKPEQYGDWDDEDEY